MDVLILLLLAVFDANFAFAKLKPAIHYVKYHHTEVPGADGDEFFCKGNFDKIGVLSSIGYSDENLADGTVTCLKADFDNDGIQDYWIYNRSTSAVPSLESEVILLNKDGSIKKVVGPPKVIVPIGLTVFSVAKNKNKGTVDGTDCDAPKVDALIALGMGHGTMNFVYVYDRKKDSWIKFSECANPDPGE